MRTLRKLFVQPVRIDPITIDFTKFYVMEVHNSVDYCPGQTLTRAVVCALCLKTQWDIRIMPAKEPVQDGHNTIERRIS